LKTGESNPFKDNPVFPQKVVYYGQPKNSECAPLNTGAKVYSCTDDDRLTYRIIPCPAGTGCTADWNGARCVECDEGSEPNPCEASLEGIMHTVPWRVGAAEHDSSCSGSNIINSYVFGSEGIDEIFYLKDGEGGIYAIVTQGSSIEPATLAIFPNGVCESPEQLRIPSTIQEVETLGLTEKEKEIMAYFMLENNVYVDFSRGINSEERFQRLTEFSRTYPCDENTLCSFRTDNAFALMAQINLARGHRALSANDYSVAQSSYQDALANLQTALNKGLPATQLVINLRSSIRLSIARLNYKQGNVEEAKRRYREVIEGDHNIGDVALQAINEYVSAFGFPGERVSTDLGTGQISTLSITALKEIKSAIEGSARSDREFLVANIKLKIADVLITYGEKSLAEGALANVLSAQAEAMELCNSIVGGRLADAKILSGARQCRANANIQAIAYLIRLNNVELGTLPGWIDGQIESKISAAENDALQSLAQSFDPSALNIIHALQKVKRSVAFARKEQAASEGQEGSYQQYLRDIRNPEVLGLLFAAPDWGDTTEAERDFRQAVDDSIKLYAALIDRIDGRENPRVTIGFQGAPAEVKNLLKIDILHKMIDYLEDTPYPNNMILANAYRQELLRLADGLPEEIGQPIRESTVQNMLSHTQTVLGQAMQQIEEEFASREAIYRDSNTWWEGEIPALEIAQDATYGEYEETINQYVYDALGRSWNSISPLRILRDVYYTNYERDFDCGQEVDSKIDRAMIGIGSALLNRILSPETYPLTLTQPNGEPLKINGAYTLQEAVFLMGKGVIPLRDIIDKYGIAENQDVDEPLLYLYKFEELWPENVEGYLSDSPDSIRDKYDQFIRLNEIGSNGLEGVRGRQISGPVNWYYIKEKDGTEKIFIGCVNYEGLDMPESSLRIGGNTPRGVIITLNDVYGHFTNPEKNPWIANLINIEKNVDSGYFDILQHQIDSVNYRKAQDLRTHLLAQKESGQGFNPFLFQTYTGILQNLAASGDPEVSLQAIDLLGEATGEGIFEVGDQFSWGDTAYSSAEQLIHPGTLVSYMMIGHAMRITGIGAEIGSGVRSAARVFRSGVGSIVARAVPRTVARSFPDYSTLVRASFGGTPRFQMIIQGGRRIGQFILEETGEEALGSAAQFAAESLTGNPLIANIIGFIAEGGTSSIDINIDGVNVNSNQIDATRIRTQTDPEATKDLAKQVGLTVLFKRLGINANYEGDIIIEGESGFRVARMTEAGITFAKGSREVTTNTLADFAQGESGSPKIRFADEEINNQFMFTNRYINEQLFRAEGEGSVGTSDIESSLTTEQALEILGYPGSDIRTVSSMIPSVDINPDLTAEDLASIIKGAAGVKTEAGIDLTRDLTRWEKIGAPAWLSNQLTGPAAEMLGISAQLEGDGITVVTAEGESVTYSQHSCSLCTLYAGGEDGPQGTVISDIIDIAHRLTPEGNGLTDAQLESANRKLADLRKLVMDFDGRGVATELDGKHIEEVTLKFGDGETARNVPYEYQRFVYNEVEGDPNTQKIGIRLRRKNSDKPWLPFVYNQETDSWLFWYNPQSKDKRIKKHQQDIRDGKEPVELKLLRALHAKRPEWKVIDIRAEDVLDRNVDVRDIKLVNARGTKTDPNDPGVRHTADFWMPKRRLFQRFADDPSITFHDTET
ncbi:hypothetical protein HYT54_03095, partial [Candidatus Woesearchaeota archaeon]|nr:hypothetical protein [Candidatus Woesearchaeota archaeon]